MRALLFLTLSVCALPSLAAEPSKSLLILDFKHEAGDESSARLLNDLVAAAAERHSTMKVITGADIRNVVALEAEKEALGCDDSSASCLAEVAGAMGADLVLFGNIGKLGEVYIVTMNLFSGEKAQSAGRETIRARDQSELPDLVDRGVARLLGAKAPPPEPLPMNTILGVSAIGAGAIVGVTGLALASVQNDALASRETPGVEKEGAFVLGHVFFWTGVGALVAGGGGAAFFFMAGDTE